MYFIMFTAYQLMCNQNDMLASWLQTKITWDSEATGGFSNFEYCQDLSLYHANVANSLLILAPLRHEDDADHFLIYHNNIYS